MTFPNEKRIKSNLHPETKGFFQVFNDFTVYNHCRYSDTKHYAKLDVSDTFTKCCNYLYQRNAI